MSTLDDKPDELADRLTDQALREVLGGESPPDLSAQILAAAEKNPTVVLSKVPNEEAKTMSRKSRIRFAIAASLFIAVCVGLIVPAMYPAHQAAKSSMKHVDIAAVTTTPTDEAKETAGQQSGQVAKLSDEEGKYRTVFESQTQTRETVPLEQQAREIVSSSGRLKKKHSIAKNNVPMQTSATNSPASAPAGTNDKESLRRDAKRTYTADLDIPGAKDHAARIKTGARGSVADRPITTSAEKRERLSLSLDGTRLSSALPASGVTVRGLRRQLTESALLRESRRLSFGGGGGGFGGLPAFQGQPGEPGQGTGPGDPGDKYTRIIENDFLKVTDSPLSTFSIDVDTASYTNVRQYLLQDATMPPVDAVRIEELVNYFAYDYAPPADEPVSNESNPPAPFAAHIEVAGCPWQAEHRLVRVGLKGREIDSDVRPPSNLVFLLDVSGSMNQPNKLPLLKRSMQLLVQNLGENDRVAIVVYAGTEGLVLPSTAGLEKQKILAALEQLRAGGSTAGGAGIRLAYKIAQDNFIKDGVNRVILCTDGDFNVGTTSTGELERLAEEKAKSGTFLTVLGFGRGNLNDEMMEAISNRGNGNYHYVDNMTEARKVLVEELSGTLVTIAKDVKIQIEFNPARVAGYRLIGYENRVLAAQDFNDDKKDAGEIGAGHTVTALYEVVPVGVKIDTPQVDPLKYQSPAEPDVSKTPEKSDSPMVGELLTLKLRYKQPNGDTSTKLEFPVTDKGTTFAQASDDFKFASAVASFGMLLRDSKYAGNATYDAVLEIAGEGMGSDELGYRKEFLEIVKRAKEIVGQ